MLTISLWLFFFALLTQNAPLLMENLCSKIVLSVKACEMRVGVSATDVVLAIIVMWLFSSLFVREQIGELRML